MPVVNEKAKGAQKEKRENDPTWPLSRGTQTVLFLGLNIYKLQCDYSKHPSCEALSSLPNKLNGI